MANTLTGTPAAAAIYVQVREHAAALDAPPCLAAVSVGAQPDDRAYLRSHVGLILQEPFLYSKTIRENVGIALREPGMERIEHAAGVASASGSVAM